MTKSTKFKFAVGDQVHVLCGWEQPLATGRISNRKYYYSELRREYEHQYKVRTTDGVEMQYEETQLEKAVGAWAGKQAEAKECAENILCVTICKVEDGMPRVSPSVVPASTKTTKVMLGSAKGDES